MISADAEIADSAAAANSRRSGVSASSGPAISPCRSGIQYPGCAVSDSRAPASQPVGVRHRRSACRGEQCEAVRHTPIHRPQCRLQVAVHVSVSRVAQQPKCPPGAVSGANAGRQQNPVPNVAHCPDCEREQPESGIRITGGESRAEQRSPDHEPPPPRDSSHPLRGNLPSTAWRCRPGYAACLQDSVKHPVPGHDNQGDSAQRQQVGQQAQRHPDGDRRQDVGGEQPDPPKEAPDREISGK